MSYLPVATPLETKRLLKIRNFGTSTTRAVYLVLVKIDNVHMPKTETFKPHSRNSDVISVVISSRDAVCRCAEITLHTSFTNLLHGVYMVPLKLTS